MGKIVAIGGGEILNNETLIIDKFIVHFSEKKNPKLLFIPTASGDSQGYIKTIQSIYCDKLGCIIDTLLLINNNISENEIKEKILSSDIIYVGGGDTVKMMEIWKDRKVDIFLKEAFHKNIILSGISAGAICWFNKGHSSLSNPGLWDYEPAIGLGLIHGINCPHYNEIGHESFDIAMKTEKLPGIAIENNCALVIHNDNYKIIKSDSDKNCYYFKNNNGTIEKNLLNNSDFLPWV